MTLLMPGNFEILDFISSKIYILVIALTLLFVIFYFVFFKRLFSYLFPASSVFNKLEYILPAFIVIPAVLTVPIFGTFGEQYGYADNAPQIFASTNSSLYILSSMNHNGRSTYQVYRLHYFDKKSGIEYNRSLLPRDFNNRNWKLINNILWIDNPRYKRVDGINLSDGSKATIDVDLLKNMDEQSKIKGINSFRVDFDINKIKVIRNDGSEILLDPFTTNKKTEIIFQWSDDNAISNFPSDFQFTLSGEIQKKLYQNGHAVLKDKFWINGSILANLSVEKHFVLFGYDDMNCDKITLECISYTLQQKWTLTTSKLPMGKLNDSFEDGGKLFVLLDNTLVCININSGEIEWQNKM